MSHVEMPEPYAERALEPRGDRSLVLADLAAIADEVHYGSPKFSRIEKALDRRGETVDGSMPPGRSSSDAKAVVDTIKSGIDTFMEDIQWFMKVLDDIARVHIFVAAPILAFKAVYSMERTRRENDKRIISLYVAMKDMIAVLVQLDDVEDTTHVGPDGRTIEARMQSVAAQAAIDIKECANVCDMYSKQKLLVKVLKGPIWEGRLADFIGRFGQRRDEFILALGINTTTVLNRVRSTVETLDGRMIHMSEILRELFRSFKSQEELYIASKVEEKGGLQLVQENDVVLRELLELESYVELAKGKSFARPLADGILGHDSMDAEQSAKLRPEASERTTQRSALFLKDLKHNLDEDWNAAVDRNMVVFERKFTMQQQLASMIHKENDRVIQNLSAGPHDRIRDEELREIWREMRWRRNVNANLFATTIRDHFREKAQRVYGPPSLQECNIACADDWTTEYMGPPYLRRIREAFDEDGSGFVTITDVNRVSESRPGRLGWSLQHWIAYWTIGWQIHATRYRDEIRTLFARLFAARKQTLPTNRAVIEQYLEKIWLPGVKLTEALRPAVDVPSHVELRFQPYLFLQEKELRWTLEQINYNIDALETVHVVIGHDKIEKHVFPLLCLLLRHHLELFNKAKHEEISQEGAFIEAATSVHHVFSAISQRYNELVALFKHRRRADDALKAFCCEMFEYHVDPSLLWRAVHMQTALDDETLESTEDLKTVTSGRCLALISQVPSFLYDTPPDTPSVQDLLAEPYLQQILGEWNGFVYSPDEYPLFLMTSFYLHTSIPGKNYNVEAFGSHYGASYMLTGTSFLSDNQVVKVQFSIRYSQEFRTKYFFGYIKRDGTLVGTVGWSEDPSTHQYRFILKRISADIMCQRPSPLEFRANKTRALWTFATRAVLFQVRQRMWSWSYFQERRETRNKLIEFDIRNYTSYGRPLNPEERQEWTRRRGLITALDARFCREIRDYRMKVIPKHLGNSCMACGYQIRGTRVVCMDCLPQDGNYTQTLDICDDPRCLETTIQAGSRPHMGTPHLPHHDFFKVRSVMHVRDLHAVAMDAREALESARRSMRCSEAPEECADAAEVGHEHPTEEKTHHVEDNHAAFTLTPARSVPRSRARYLESSVVASGNRPSCKICDQSVKQPCWFCVDCFTNGQSALICDSCESQAMLRCARCAKVCKQPMWYHGSRADNFICDSCTVNQHALPPSKVSYVNHTYLHVLVRCGDQNAASGGELSTKEDVAAAKMRQELRVLTQHMREQASQVERMHANVERLEQMLRVVLEKLDPTSIMDTGQ
ncbi:hypothetical protein BDW22DRAFT_412068 [Trametopsis cervina]|nr:hypothetical protein BDW22DRAFT_412068 [Trametopsis cervina]